MNDTSGRRAERLVAAVALCVLVLVGAVPGLAVASTGASHGDSSAAVAVDRESGGIGDIDLDAVSGGAPVGSALGQLVGVLVVLLVLAGIGVAAWEARPDAFRGLNRTSSALSWLPGRRVDAAENPGDGTLLTDEERIIELLEENDGRLKQQRVVETTDWSKAKVSRLLSSMEDDDAIVRIQLGREKLIFLSGQEPRGARSVHREEG